MKNRNLNHKDHWATPTSFKAEIYKKYDIDFDPCPYMHDLSFWDGLNVEWGERNYINPGYNLKVKTAFVKKAIEESKKGKLCVMLLPVSTSTVLYHDYILPNMKSREDLRGRLLFVGVNDKGQMVNHDNPTKETIPYEVKIENEDGEIELREIQIPLHVKQSGQHDSMIIIFDGR